MSVRIDVDRSGHEISPHLVGLHQVYTFTPDHVFEEGAFTEWVSKSGFSTSRFPGGSTVKYWDWEAPTGQPFEDPLSPEFDASLNESETEWMSLDEYLGFVEATGMTPLIGVNSYLGTVHGVEEEMIEKAVRSVRYVKERGFGGGFWYIGNEEMYKHGGPEGYARVFRRYAERMKAEDPEIRIFWNDNNPTERKIRAFLENDGGTADGLEAHGKWPFGGSPNLPSASYEEWLDEVPLRDRKNGDRKEGGRRWRDAADEYREIAASMGRDLLIANNEYGFGKKSYAGSFPRYEKGLLVTEFLMELLIGNWDMTAFWDLTRGTVDGVLDKQNDYRVNPAGLGMALLADAQGGQFLHTVETEIQSVHGFAARKDGAILLYLLNKTVESQSCEIAMRGARAKEVALQFLVESKDGYAELTQGRFTASKGTVQVELPAMSFAKIILRDPVDTVSVQSMRKDVSGFQATN
ncbi:hypothetical protein [Pelagicoccus mobilis]|uniref:hypothetical protein n=1 Tax=Pelagicoccus mobilis TaxID=415221 RepID=UPI001905EDE1|nr:hypothetical protein [Pelagicoccus mobilis]